MYTYNRVLNAQEIRVRSSLIRPVLDRNRPDYDAFLSESSGGFPNADHSSNSSDLERACYVFFAEDSSFQGNEELFERIFRSRHFQRN